MVLPDEVKKKLEVLKELGVRVSKKSKLMLTNAYETYGRSGLDRVARSLILK